MSFINLLVCCASMAHLMEAEVALDAMGGEEHFAFACEYKQEPIQRLKHDRCLNTSPKYERESTNTFSARNTTDA